MTERSADQIVLNEPEYSSVEIARRLIPHEGDTQSQEHIQIGMGALDKVAQEMLEQGSRVSADGLFTRLSEAYSGTTAEVVAYGIVNPSVVSRLDEDEQRTLMTLALQKDIGLLLRLANGDLPPQTEGQTRPSIPHKVRLAHRQEQLADLRATRVPFSRIYSTPAPQVH